MFKSTFPFLHTYLQVCVAFMNACTFHCMHEKYEECYQFRDCVPRGPVAPRSISVYICNSDVIMMQNVMRLCSIENGVYVVVGRRKEVNTLY